MTISSESNRNSYTGNGTTSEYDFTYKIIDESNLSIFVNDPDTGAETSLLINTDYTVNDSSISLVDNGQVWIDVNGFLDADWVIVLLRIVGITQETDIRNQGDFYPEVHEDEFDKLTMIDQQQQDDLDRSISLPKSIDSSDFNTEMPPEIVGSNGLALVTNEAGDGFAVGPSIGAIEGANQSAINAAASAVASEASSVTSAASALSAQTAQTGAETAQTGAEIAETNALASKVAAATSETNAATSETAAAASAVDAANSAAASSWQDVVYVTDINSPIGIVQADNGNLYASDTTGGNIIVNLPQLSSLDLSNPWKFGVKKTDTSVNTITINAFAGDTIGGQASVVISRANAGMTLIPDDNWTSVSFGEVPIDGAIVGTTDTQTLTNKTYKDTVRLDPRHDTLANLITYAALGTTTSGQLCYATDEEQTYQIINNELVLVGGAGGAGDTSVYKLLQGSEDGIANWDVTGILGASFTLDADDAYIWAVNTNNGAEVTIDFPLSWEHRNGEAHKLTAPFILTGTDDVIEIELWDKTNSVLIETVIPKGDDPLVKSYWPLKTCTEITYKLKAITDGVASLKIDKQVFSDKFGEYGSETISETITATGYLSGGGGNITLGATSLVDTSDVLVKRTDIAETRYTFLRTCTFWTVGGGINSGSTTDQNTKITLYDKDDVEILQIYNRDAYAGGNPVMGTLANTGDYIVINNSSTTLDNAVTTNFSVTATAQSQTKQFEDTYEQGHDTASFGLEGNDGRAITVGTEDIHFSGTGEGWTSSGDDNYYTVQKDDSVIDLGGTVKCTTVGGRAIDLYVDTGAGFVEHKRIAYFVSQNYHKFQYVSYRGEFSIGDKISIRFSTAGGTLENSATGHYLNLTESNLPSAERASATRLLSIPLVIHSTDEFYTGEKWIDDRKIYARSFEVASDTAVNGAILTTWDTGLEPIGCGRVALNDHVILNGTTSGTTHQAVYQDDTGNVVTNISSTMYAGTKITMRYVK